MVLSSGSAEDWISCLRSRLTALLHRISSLVAAKMEEDKRFPMCMFQSVQCSSIPSGKCGIREKNMRTKVTLLLFLMTGGTVV